MRTELTNQLRDYLDWEGPPTLHTATASSPRRGVLVAIGVGVIVLGVGILSSLLGGGPPPTGSAEWCPEGELPPAAFPIDVPETCDGPLIGQWQLSGLVVGGERVAIPSYESRGHQWTGVLFRANGSLTAVACNEISGWYKATDTNIATGHMWMTAAACLDDDPAVESALLTVIPLGPTPEPHLTYEIDDDQLTLMSGEVVMTLRRVMKGPPPPSLDDPEWCPDGDLPSVTDHPEPGEIFCDGPLVGDWELVSVNSGGEEVPLPTWNDSWQWAGVSFQNNGTWSAQFCNRVFSYYAMGDSSIRTGPDATSTAAGCSAEQERVTGIIFQAVSSRGVYTVEGNRLEFSSGDIRVVFRAVGPGPEANQPSTEWCPSGQIPEDSFEPFDEPAVCEGPLIGLWRLVSIETSGDLLPIPDPERPGHLTFSSDGRWGGVTCNSYGGPFTMNNTTIRTGGYSTTLAGCFGPEGDIENAILRVMDRSVVDYFIVGDRLTLVSGDTFIEMVRR